MNIVKTKKGTELPLRLLQGKQYLEVSYRVLWMREEHPEWGIETEFLQLTSEVAIAKSTIKDGQGKIIAQGTKTETPKGFADYIEKAETGSVGRALALCGYGTQFAQELEEGDRIVDAPKELRKPQEPTSAQPPADPLIISEAQLKRLYAIQKKSGIPEDAMKAIGQAMGITTRSAIPKAKYEQFCHLVENWKP